MGFPTGYPSDLVIPKLLVHILCLLVFIRNLILLFFNYLTLLHHFFILQPHHHNHNHPIIITEPPQNNNSVFSLLIRQILPVLKFSDLHNHHDIDSDNDSCCAVCLNQFQDDEDIRRLTNCTHIFHKACLDRWMGYDHRTCPLCRTPFLPYDLHSAFNERLWLASSIPDFYSHQYHPHF